MHLNGVTQRRRDATAAGMGRGTGLPALHCERLYEDVNYGGGDYPGRG
jgi:hypothetical protein